MKLTEILGRFRGAEPDHDGHVAFCPAHSDTRTPSLKLTLKDDGQLLIVCRAGCNLDDVLKSVELSKAALFDVDGQGVRTISAKATELVGAGEIAGLTMFIDESAAALPSVPEAINYIGRRFGLSVDAAEDLGIGYAEPGDRPYPWLSKRFTGHPRIVIPMTGFDGVHRGAQGRDIGGACTARWVSLSNVPGKEWAKFSVLRSGAGFDTFLICEGPGDALSAVGAGYNAVAVRGAGLARNASLVAELVDGLRDFDVVIAGDRDRAGAGFTDSLSTALVKGGVMVRRLTIPRDGWDLTDWREDDSEAFSAQLHSAVRAAEVVELGEATAVTVITTVGPSSTEMDFPTSNRETFENTEVGLATRLFHHMGGLVRHVDGMGFLTWNGRCWVEGERRVRREIHLLGARLLEEGKTDAAKKTLTSRHIGAILTELPSVPGVAAEVDDFDASKDILSCANGTVDLRTGILRPHDPADMVTQCLQISYDPNAQAPRWEQYLVEVMPSHPEMPAYLQRVVGYGVTGHTNETCFIVHHGEGGNGKSQFTGALNHVFRGIATEAEFKTFEERPASGAASPELAKLRGYRLVMSSESEKYARLAEGLIKQLTGGGGITCRFLHKNLITYTPRYLLQLETNYKPAILSTDHGIWRRVKLVPWEAKFKGRNADKNLLDKLKAESEGILAWAVRGSVEWYRSGLGEPSSVTTATQDYKESEDRLGEFLESQTIPDDESRVQPMDMRRAYRDWAEDAGLSRKEILSGWSLGVELESRGFKKRKSNGKWGFDGIRLMTDAERDHAARPASEPAHDDGTVRNIFGEPKGAA